jgi:hypothetical protein
MKNLILALVFTIALTFGINTVNASDFTPNAANTENIAGVQIKVRVYEDGAIWVYVYAEDGSFVVKYQENL